MSLLDEKKIPWRTVINDIANKTNAKKDFTVNPKNTTIDNETGKFIMHNNSFGYKGFEMTDWATSQYFQKLGMPVSYFKELLSEGDFDYVKSHIDLNRERKSPDELFIRTVVPKDAGTRVVRSVLTPSFTPFDDDELANLLRQLIGESNKDVSLIDYRNDGLTSYFRLVFPDTMKDIKSNNVEKDDIVAVGANVTNSEVGKSSVKVLPLVYRLRCKNGMLSWSTIGNKNEHYQRHSYIDQDKMYKFIKNTINKSIEIAYNLTKDFEELRRYKFEPDNVENILAKTSLKNKLYEPILEVHKDYWNRANNLFALVNSMTRAAKQYNQDDQKEIEDAAGKLTEQGLEELGVA